MAVQLTLGPFPDPVTTRLVEAIAARLPAVVADPGGPRRFAYRSPIFPADYLNACEISTADDFHAVFGVPPGPSVRESIAPSVGRIEFTTAGGLAANYVRHECRRHSTAEFTKASELVITTMTYDSGEAAQADLAFTRSFGDGTDTPTRLGEESILASVLGDRSIEFRAGLTVVGVSLYDGPGRLSQPLDSALLTAATIIANRVPR